MKSLSIVNICSIVYNLVTIQCSTENERLCEENVHSGDDPSFSFDKDTYDKFEFHLTDKMLSSDSFCKLPFCRCTPVWNFVYSFCLFFQQSLVKHDDEFLEIFKKFFECCHEKNGEDDDESEKFKHENFEDLLSQQEECIKNILDEKDLSLQQVVIEEKNGRIYCRLNESLKITYNDLKSISNITLEDKTSSAMMYFFMRYNEMYLENLLGSKFTETFDRLNEKYIESSLNPLTSEFTQSDSELFELYSKVICIYKAEEGFVDKGREECREFGLKFVRMLFDGYTTLMHGRTLGFEVPKYLDKLMSLSTMKILFNISDNLDSFSNLHEEYPNTILRFKNHLRKYFEKYNLSEKSIESLTFLCFEMVL